MKIDGKLFTVFIMALALIPGAYGESVSVGRGSSVAVSEGSSAEGILTSDGSITQSSVSSVGVIDDLSIDPWVQNTKGDYAEIGVTGTNVAGFSYSDNYYPGKGSGWVSNAVWAQQWLGASSANYLYAYSYARNAAGDKARAEMTINYGSLNGYYNSAYAGPAPWLGMDRGAFVQQTAKSATGNNILAQTYTNDAPGDSAGSRTEVKYGSLMGYSALANGVRYSDGMRAAGVSVDWVSASAPLGSINQLTWSQDYRGNRVEVGTAINKGNLYSYPYNSYYPSLAYSIGDWDWTGAVQSVDASSSGFGNYFTSYGKFYDTFYGSIAYNQAYTDGRLRFWNSAATLPTFAGEWHGTFW